MFTILVASFLVVCVLMVVASVIYGRLHRELKAEQEEIILAAEPLRPEWIYGRRMDVPGKFPAVRSRRAKVLR